MPARAVAHPPSLLFGIRLRDLRKRRGLSLNAAARLVRIHKGSLSNIEHGLVNITLKTILRIARGLRVDPIVLVGFPEGSRLAWLAERVAETPPEALEAMNERWEEIVRFAQTPRRKSA